MWPIFKSGRTKQETREVSHIKLKLKTKRWSPSLFCRLNLVEMLMPIQLPVVTLILVGNGKMTTNFLPAIPVTGTFKVNSGTPSIKNAHQLFYPLKLGTTWLALANVTITNTMRGGSSIGLECRGLYSLATLKSWDHQVNNPRLAYWRMREHTEQTQAIAAEVVLDPSACQLPDRRMGPFKTIQPQIHPM